MNNLTTAVLCSFPIKIPIHNQDGKSPTVSKAISKTCNRPANLLTDVDLTDPSGKVFRSTVKLCLLHSAVFAVKKMIRNYSDLHSIPKLSASNPTVFQKADLLKHQNRPPEPAQIALKRH